MENPYDLFYYGKYLMKEYSDQVYDLCYREISESCAQTKDRREYKKMTKQKYPKRPALLEKLKTVEKKL